MKKPTKAAKKKKVVAVSGGFDPLHIGHIRYIQEARKLGDELVVILNNDNWLKLKKGYAFMPETERKEILEAIAGVSRVFITEHTADTDDISICAALRSVRPDVFAKGGDRNIGNIPEVAVCEEIDCEIVSDIGAGGKVQSSSWLIEKSKAAMKGKK